ncbi:MAG: hypothetical protein MUD12_06110 [Spirochaetes bacterium]|jgi:hypothetical protein|nr:hypothetical protein [Spirochaetota bacterium]
MNYKIISPESEGVILKKTAFSSIFFWLILSIGLFSLLPSLPVLFSENPGAGFGFLGFGLVFISGSLILKGASRLFPEKITFDNNSNRMILSGKKKSAYIGYGDIEGFRLYRFPRGGSFIYLKKKDGAPFDLIRCGTGGTKKPDETIRLLESKTTFDSGKARPECAMPEWASMADNAGRTVFSWNERISIIQFISIFFMFAGFGLSIYGLSDNQFIKYAVSAAFTVVGCLYVLYHLAEKTIFRLNVLVVGVKDVQYGSARNLDSFNKYGMRIKKTINIYEIKTTWYSMDQVAGNFPNILIMDDKAIHLLDDIRTRNYSVQDIKKMLKEYYGLFKIPVANRDLTDLVNLEQAIHAAIEEKR